MSLLIHANPLSEAEHDCLERESYNLIDLVTFQRLATLTGVSVDAWEDVTNRYPLTMLATGDNLTLPAEREISIHIVEHAALVLPVIDQAIVLDRLGISLANLLHYLPNKKRYSLKEVMSLEQHPELCSASRS